MHKEMTLEELERHQPDLLAAFLRDHSPAEAVREVNKILIDFDGLKQLDEDRDYEETEAPGQELAERVKAKMRGMAGLRKN